MLEDSMAVGWSLRGIICDTGVFCINSPVYTGEPVLIHKLIDPSNTSQGLTYNNMYVCDVSAGKVHDSNDCPDSELPLLLLKIAKKAPQLKFAVISRRS